MEFRLLGDIEARIDGRPVEIGHARQRCVLVALLAEANHAVSVDQLMDRVWGERPPHRARDALYSYLSRLRKALAAADDVGIARQSSGYVLTVDETAVDLHRFHRLLAQARAAEDEDAALVLFEQALGLWRGEAFAALDTPWLNAMRETLERERLAVELDYYDLQLRRGQHTWLLAELSTKAAAHPLDERLAGQLMLALYHCGRQADALEHFQQLRRRLADELGIDPGSALQRLYEQILTTDPALTGSIATRSAPASAQPPVPRQLPAHTPYFVGRAEELRQLTALLDTATHERGTVVITAIDGTAGIGKTALALHWAHQARQRFPDGQLYVNLRGFDPTSTPMHPTEAIRGFLDAFEIPPERIPVSLDAQAGLYRSLLADRHVLLVLDNARDVDQVRPLLPGSPTCLAVITSRNQLTGLVAQEGARPVTLDILSPQEAAALLGRHLGQDRVTAEPHAVAELIDQCAGLPLALAIVAARAAAHPSFSLAVLAEELADENTRLDALDAGDPETSVWAVFSWSYQQLTTLAARMFRLLGVHPGADISLPAAASLAGIGLGQARKALGELTRAHLLAQHTPGRFTFHDLLRAYATHLAAAEECEAERRAALTRLFDHYLATAAAAMDTLVPAEQHRRPRIPPPATPTPAVADPTAARAWLDIERPTLTGITAYTAAHGWPDHTTRLASTLYRYLEVGGHYPDALAIHTHALNAARHTDDPEAEARALNNLGIIYFWQGRYEQAAEHHQQALALFRELGHRAGEAEALTRLGLVYWRQGRYEQAADHHQQALALFRELGHRVGEADALTNLGIVYWQQGRYEQAADHHQLALALFRELGYRYGEADVLNNLGTVYWRQSRYEQAADHLQQALVLFREIGYRYGEARALNNLGLVYRRQSRYEQAADHHQQALALFREIGDRAGEARALNGIGETLHATGQLREARIQHTTALTLASQIGDRNELARAHNGLAHTHNATGDPDQARHHWRHALALYTDLGVPDVNDVRAHLATLGLWAPDDDKEKRTPTHPRQASTGSTSP